MLRRAAFARLRYADAGLRVLPQLVPQRAYGNAENVRGVSPVAKAMVERIENEIALDIGNRAPNERASGDGGGFGGDRNGISGTVRAGLEASPVGQPDRVRRDLGALGKQDGTMDRVLELANVAAPGMRQQQPLGFTAD